MPWEPTHTLRTKLREHKALDYIMVATDSDDDPQRVNVPSHRNRAQKVLRVLSEMSWTVIEFFDKRGGLLGRHVRGPEDEPPAGELESLGPSPRVAEVSGLLALLLKAQDTVLVRFTGMLQPLLDAQYKLVDVSMKRLDLQEKQFQHAVRVNSQMADDLVRAQLALVQHAGAGDDEDGGMAGPILADMMPAFVRAALSKDEGPGDKPRPSTNPKGKPKGKRAPTPGGRPPPNGANGQRSE